MFVGVVHANARKVIASCIELLPARAHVICSGNFTLEATLRLNGYKGALTGSDVSLYTCSLGAYFAGSEIPLRMNLDGFPDLAPLADCLGDQEGRAAAVALALDVVAVYRRRSEFQRRMFRHYQRRMAELADKTIARLRRRRELLRLDAFHARDGWERAVEIPAGDGDVVLTFPPTYSGGYERLYRDLDALFTWEAPRYRPLTTGAEFAARVAQRPGPWIIGTEKRDGDVDAVLGQPFAVAPRDTQVRIHLYTNLEGVAPKVVRRTVNAAPPPWPRLEDGDEIRPDSALTVHRVSSPQANWIRQVYASVEVGQASAQYSYAAAVDGRCVGILLFQEPTFGMRIEGAVREFETIYMMADIAVASERYPRLSKLLLMAALSRELRHDLEARCVREIAYCVTTAFSRRPVSMKYRGIFKLLSRKEQGDTFVLNYYARTGQWTLAEAMRSWSGRYGAGGKTTAGMQVNAHGA